MEITKIIIMEICKPPTLRLKALNKHTHIMYIEMKNVIKNIYILTSVQHNYAKNAHILTHARTHALYRLMGVKDNVV